MLYERVIPFRCIPVDCRLSRNGFNWGAQDVTMLSAWTNSVAMVAGAVSNVGSRDGVERLMKTSWQIIAATTL